MLRRIGSLWSLTRGSRRLYAWAFLAMSIASCLLYLVPLVPVAVIDGVLAPTPEKGLVITGVLEVMGGPEQILAHPWIPALLMIGISTAAGVATYLRSRWTAAASESIVKRLRDTLYDHLQRLPCSHLDGAETGDLLQRATSDVETVRQFLTNQVIEIGRALLMLLVPLPLLVAIDLRMTAAALALTPLITAFTTLFFFRMRAAFEATDEAEGRMTTAIQENLTGIRVVRAFARQSFEIERFGERNSNYRDLDRRMYRLMAIFWSLSDLMVFSQQVIIVGVGIWLMRQDELAIGAFFYFLAAVGLFMAPMRQMGRILADLSKAIVSIGRIEEILETPAEPVSPLDPAPAFESGRIEFEGVVFRYGSGAPVLDGLTLTIEPRSTVAFVGASGAGKSTLTALLLRLYDPSEGRIRLGGIDLRDLDRASLRRQIALVMQQPFLFSKSIRDNLRLGRTSATQEQIEGATVAALIHDTIIRFEQGYDTEIGERGVTLSGGQRSRLALARALLADADVLVLDDALSAVDTRTEQALLATLDKRRGQKTTLLISHRLSVVTRADCIYVLDGGRAVEHGDHKSLLAMNGSYARLWRAQSLSHGTTDASDDDSAGEDSHGARP